MIEGWMIKNAALQEVSGLVVRWRPSNGNIHIHFDVKWNQIHFDGDVKDK